MKIFHRENKAVRTFSLGIVIFAFSILSLAFLPAHAGQLFPSPNPAGNTIDTPADFGDPPAVTAHNDINYTNNGTVKLWGSFDNNGTFNNNGTLTDIVQFINHNNNAGAVWNNNAGASMDNGNGHFHNAAGAVFNNYGTYTNAGMVYNYGTITNHAGGHYWNGVQTWNYNSFVNNGTYEGWIYRNYAGTTTNNGTWIHHSGIVQNVAGATFNNNGTMTTEGVAGIYNEGGTFNNNAGASITNAAGCTYRNKNGGIFNNAGTITNSGTVNIESGAFNNTGTLTNNGTLSNFGGAVLNSSGTLTNNTGKTFTNGGTFTNTGYLNNAGTLNNSGSLELASGSSYNFTGGTINNNNNGTLILRRDFTLDGTTSGTVNLNTGSTLQNYATLTNPVGHTQVNNGTFLNNSGGTFINNGTFSTSTTFINNGRFQGTGTTNGDVINNGTIAPGNSIGTMYINSAYVQNAGSTYEVEINGSGQSDRIVTNGTATLNGGTVFVIPSGLFLANTPYTYTILNAAGGVTGMFSNLTANSAFLTNMYLTYLPRDVLLTFTRKSLQTVCETQNQCAVAGGLEGGYPVAAGDMRNILNMILVMSGPEARNAYDRTGGYIHTAIPAIVFSSYNQYRDMMAARMAGFVSGGPSNGPAVKPVMISFRTDTGNDAQNRLLTAANTTLPGSTNKTMPAWGFWMDTYGSFSGRRADDVSSRYDYNTAGVIAGFDKKVTPSFLVGASAGYSYAKADLKDLSEDARISSYQGSLYGVYTKGPWYVSGIGSYAFNTYDTSRDMAFAAVSRSANASYNSHLFAGYLEGGYKVVTKFADIIPFAAFQATYLARQSFSEDGAGALSLNVDKENTASYIVSAGIRLRKEYAIPAGTLTPELRVRWDHELSNDNHSLRASFTGYPQTAFTVNADTPDRDRLAAGIGINLKMKENIYLNLSYDGYFSHDTTRHSGMLGFQYKF
jgi:uncharacterized protein with beta-barrel porin domain